MSKKYEEKIKRAKEHLQLLMKNPSIKESVFDSSEASLRFGYSKNDLTDTI